MNLYHFTSAMHLPHIVEAGHLRPTESNIDAIKSRVGPDVVWLVDTPTLGFDHGLGVRGFKTQIRFTVEASRAVRWVDWAWTHKMEPRWRDALVEAGGGKQAAEHWWVVPGYIQQRYWVEIRDMASGEVLYERGQ